MQYPPAFAFPGLSPRTLARPVLSLLLALPLLPLAGCGGTPSTEELIAAERLPGSPTTKAPVQQAGHSSNSSAAGPSAPAGELRVMSVNARYRTMLDLHNNWPNRRDLFVATIKRFDPDLLSTQECLISQTRDLQAALSGYGYVGAGRNDGHESGEMCGVFYKRDRFRKLDAGHFWLSDKPDTAGSRDWGAWFPRIVTWVKLEARDQPDKELYLFNTHFSVFASGARYNSAVLLRERIAQIAGDAPTIVTGDFNTTENTEPYRILTEGRASDSRPLLDTYRIVEPQRRRDENTIHNFGGGTRGQRIDWILASPQFSTVDAAINRTHFDSRYPSDHFPVQAVLRWPGSIATAAEPETEADNTEG